MLNYLPWLPLPPWNFVRFPYPINQKLYSISIFNRTFQRLGVQIHSFKLSIIRHILFLQLIGPNCILLYTKLNLFWILSLCIGACNYLSANQLSSAWVSPSCDTKFVSNPRTAPYRILLIREPLFGNFTPAYLYGHFVVMFCISLVGASHFIRFHEIS